MRCFQCSHYLSILNQFEDLSFVPPSLTITKGLSKPGSPARLVTDNLESSLTEFGLNLAVRQEGDVFKCEAFGRCC